MDKENRSEELIDKYNQQIAEIKQNYEQDTRQHDPATYEYEREDLDDQIDKVIQ